MKSLARFNEEKADAWRDHGDRFACEHVRTELRKRVIAGGGVQYVQQCTRCGESRSQPMARARALEGCGGVEPASFDVALATAWCAARDQSAADINAKFNRTAFFDGYSEYLASTQWAKRRRAIFARANGKCEGCGEGGAEEVHHLTYEHVGAEFLFELVAVCRKCHERLHADDEGGRCGFGQPGDLQGGDDDATAQ